MRNLYFGNTELTGGFWKHYEDLNRNVTIHSVYDRFLETGRFDALKCDWREGMEKKPHIFWDSDVAKWIESAAYILEKHKVPELEEKVDELVDRIAANQRSDGYFNSHFLSVNPAQIYLKREWHELYCTGHMIEAAIAYHRATGKDKLLQCVLKNVDCIERAFVREKTAAFVTPGHEEIELALLKLYEYRGDPRHLELARFFLDQRGNNEKEEKNPYNQSDMPCRKIESAKGHAVRAGYLYTAMAMLAGLDGDEEMLAACKRVWKDITTTKMSVTGGIGADHHEERFSYSYDLPNSDTYNETCAAISLALFASAMQQVDTDSSYGNVIERILYNGFLSGLSLDGEKFFYANALEIDAKKYQRSTYQPSCERVKVFNCSCCPPNVTRILSSIPRFLYTVGDEGIFCNQFMRSSTRFFVKGKEAILTQETDYPFSGKIRFTYRGEKTALFVRIPDWCVEWKGKTEKGFCCFDLTGDDDFTIDLPMEIHFIEANPKVQDDAGRCALQRGPVVYCLEGIDNGENLRDVTLMEDGHPEIIRDDTIPAPVLMMDAERREPFGDLYRLRLATQVSFRARLIPYFAFANREKSDMILWTMVR